MTKLLSFEEQQFLILMLILSFFLFIVSTLYVLFKKFLYKPRSIVFLTYVFLSKFYS